MYSDARFSLPHFCGLSLLSLAIALLLWIDQSSAPKSLAADSGLPANPNIAGSNITGYDTTPSINSSLPSSPLFWDDFSGDLSQWTPLYGNWHIDQAALVGDAGGCCYMALIYAGDPAWTDYVFQTQVITETENTIMVLKSSEPGITEYRVEFWWQGSYAYPNKYNAYKYLNGNFEELPGGFGTSPIPITQTSLLKVQIIGSHLTLFVDDQFVADIVDLNPLPSGKIGLGVWNVTATFDDVLVSTPPPVVLYPIDETSYVKAGESITYTLELANYTGEIDSFNLDILPGNVWTTTLSTEQVGPIENGGNAYLTARVDVPPAAQAGDNSVATIQASSVTSPTVYTATSILDTIVYTSTSAYVITSHKLFLVDRFLYTSVGSIDLTQYGCMIAYKAILSPNMDELYVACFQNQTIIVFNTFDNSYLTSITLPDWIFHGDITFTRDGAYAVVGGDSITDIYVIDTSTYSIVKTVHSFYTTSLATHPYLPYIYIGGFEGYNGFIQVLDTRTFTMDKTIGLGFIPARDVQCSPDGQWVYATGGVMIFKINTQTNEIVDQLTRPHDVYTLSVAPDSNKFFASSTGVALEVYGAQSFTYITTIYLPDNLMMDMQFTCDGSELWAANGTEHMPVIDPNDYTIPHQILIPNEDPIGIAMCSPISTGVFARKAADLTHASPGEKVRYTFSLYNYGPDNLDNAIITDTLPITLNYMIGSLHSTSGDATYQDGVIYWTGPLTSSMSVDVDFTARVDQSVGFGDSITNSAVFNTHFETYTRSATINIVPYQLLMPCVTRACGPFYFDNFSDPNSGWPIEDTQHAVMGYRDGEYQIYVRDAGWLVFAYQDLGVTDYMVEMDTRPASHLNGGTGIIFSLTESGFYLFEISDGWFSLWRYDPGGWAQVIGWRRSSALNPGFATNHLAVVRKQMEIRLYANSYLIGQTNDYTYSGTRVGMVSDAFTENYDGRFDNFSVTIGVCMGGYSSTLTPAATSIITDFWFSQRPAPEWSVPFHDK